MKNYIVLIALVSLEARIISMNRQPNPLAAFRVRRLELFPGVSASSSPAQQTPILMVFTDNTPGSAGLVRMFLEQGADPFELDASGKSVLDFAKEKGNKELVDIFSVYEEARSKPTLSTLDKAIKLDLSALVKQLLSVNKNITNAQLKEIIELYQEAKNNPTQAILEKAVKLGVPTLVQLMLSKLPLNGQLELKYGKLAQTKYAETEDEAYKKIARLLYERVNLQPGVSTVSKAGPLAEKLPIELITNIGQYLPNAMPFNSNRK